MKRVVKVMLRNEPLCRLNCHGSDLWSAPWDPDRLVGTANTYLEHFPCLSNLWLGELHDDNMPPDYWLVEISGIPFGLTSEMLNHQTDGSPYRGMWHLWDQFGIQDAEWLGHLDPHCPLKTDQPSVLASVYRKPGKWLTALGHWPAARERGAASPGLRWWPLSL